MELRYNGSDVASITFSGMWGQKAVGGWALRFSLTFQTKQVSQGPHASYKAEGIYDLRAHVSVSSASSELVFLGVAHCRQQRFMSIRDHSQQEGRLFDLSLLDGQLAALEEMRGAGGITFHFDIYAQGDGTAGPWPLETVLKKDFNISEWTKLLEDMGAAEYLCVPVLLPQSRVSDPHNEPIGYVRQAQGFLLQGEYRAAVARCREALELLTGLHDAAAGPNGALSTKSVLEAFRKDRREMSRAQRLVFLRIAANHLTHLGHHPPESSRDVLSRQDAALAIAACAGLISASMTEGLAQARSIGDQPSRASSVSNPAAPQ